MSHIEDESNETLLAMAAIEPTRRAFIEAELRSRSSLLVESVVNNPAGVYDADDGTPDAPAHLSDNIWPSIN